MQRFQDTVAPTLAQNTAAEDTELMLRIQRGDRTALGMLVGRYWMPLVHYATRTVGSTDDAEDMVQQAFVTVWSERARYRPRGTPQAYLYRIVRNEALQECRRCEVRDRRSREMVLRGNSATPLDETIGQEFCAALQEALAALPRRRREAFVLARYYGLSLKEISEVMHISAQTAANHISLAMADLRRAVAAFLE